MVIVCNQDSYSETFDSYFSSFGLILNKLFNNKLNNHKINALIILQQLKEKIDPLKLKEIVLSMPEERWSMEIISKKIVEINSLFGITDEEIKKHCIDRISTKEIPNIKLELNLSLLLESSKHANEYYDNLKYNRNSELTIPKMSFLTELMLVFKMIKESSDEIYKKFEKAKPNQKIIESLNIAKFRIDILWLRILYILLKLDNADEKKLDHLTELLSKERISLTHQKIIGSRFS